MTREQFAAIMARLLGVHGVGTPPAAPNPFADVTGWAQGYIAAVSEVGLIQGFGDGTFKPGGFVTSAHVATVVARFLAIPQLQSCLADRRSRSAAGEDLPAVGLEGAVGPDDRPPERPRRAH